MRPLQNVLAIRVLDPALRVEVIDRWRGVGEFDAVFDRPDGWVVAVAALGGAFDEPVVVDGAMVVWAEGRERVSDSTAFVADLRLRPDRMADVPGDVAALLVGASGMVAMRSPSGLVPWYIHSSPSMVAVGTRLAWFPRHVPANFEIDAFAHAIAIDGLSCVGDRTPLRGLRSVPVGHTLSVSIDGGERLERFWRPERLTPNRTSAARAQEAGRELRRLLVSELSADLDPGGRNLLGLSGGVDSSCLAALTHRELGTSFDAFTFLPAEDHPALPTVSAFVDSITTAAPPRRHWRFHLTEQRRVESHGRAPAVGLPVPHPALSHLPAMVAETGPGVFVGGEAADDLFGGPFTLGKDWVENVSILQLASSLRRPWPMVARRFVARQWLDARLGRRTLPLPVANELPAVLRPEIRSEYSQWVADLTAHLRADDHPYRHLRLFFLLDGWLRQNWEVCSELGVRRSFPFWRRPVIELAMSLHPAAHALPAKRIIRLGLARDVPLENLHRVDKGSWAERLDVDIELELPDRLGQLVDLESLAGGRCRFGYATADVLAVLTRSTAPVNQRS